MRTIVAKLSSALVAALTAGACSMTLPVHGVLDGSPETFTGSATGYPDGSGTIQIVTTIGTTCAGNFVYVTRREGEGVFRCSDGSSGPFKFVSTRTSGTGYGDFRGKRFTFTFG